MTNVLSIKPRLSDILADAALRIGATQILFMDTPVYAAVSETVESLRMHPKINVSYVFRNSDHMNMYLLLLCT